MDIRKLIDDLTTIMEAPDASQIKYRKPASDQRAANRKNPDAKNSETDSLVNGGNANDKYGEYSDEALKSAEDDYQDSTDIEKNVSDLYHDPLKDYHDDDMNALAAKRLNRDNFINDESSREDLEDYFKNAAKDAAKDARENKYQKGRFLGRQKEESDIDPEKAAEIENRLKSKASLAQKNKNSYNDLSYEEKDYSKNKFTGGVRTRKDAVRLARKRDPSMSDAYVKELIRDAREGAQDAYEELYAQYVGMLIKLADQYSFGQPTSSRWENLFAEASVAFVHAIDTFDVDRDVKFSTWLHSVAGGEVRNVSKTMAGDVVDISTHQFDNIVKFNKSKAARTAEGLRGTDLALAIISDLGLKNWDEYDKIRQHATTGADSMNATFSADEGEPVEVGDLMSRKDDGSIGTGASPEKDLENIEKNLRTSSKTMKSRTFKELADKADLSPEEKEIIYKTFGIGEQDFVSQDSIQIAMGLPYSRFMSFYNSAVKKISLYIAERNGTKPADEEKNIRKIIASNKKSATNAKKIDDTVVDKSTDDKMQDAKNIPGYEKYREIRKLKQQQAKEKMDKIKAQTKERNSGLDI